VKGPTAYFRNAILGRLEKREKAGIKGGDFAPLKAIRRTIGYYPISIRSIYSEVPRGSGKIPNHVYQTWKRPVLPLLLALEVKRFRAMNLDYSFSFFDDRRMADYMSGNYAGHPILEVFRAARTPVIKADIWRYCLLYREGGVYCDIKSAMTVPLREVIHDDYSELIAFEGLQWKNLLFPGSYADKDILLPAPPHSIRSNLEYPDNTILNWLLCFERGNPILEEVINLIVRHASFYRKRIFDNVSMAGNHFTGVIAFTQAVWMWMQKTGERPQQAGLGYHGHGRWKLRGMDYRESPHHTSMRNMSILD
jgi:inositol phosphorylceramide mannosyltransferase catalytic subunit